MHRTRNKLMFAASFRLNVTLVAFLALSLVAVHAQENDREKQRLKSVEQTRQELETERQRIKLEQQSQENDLKEALEHQKKLIDEIVERKFAIAQKEKMLENKREEREKLRQQQDQFNQQGSEIRIIAADAYRKLSDLLDTLPPSESRTEQRKLLSEIKSSLEKTSQAQFDITALVELLESLLEESRTTSVFHEKIRNPQGYEQEVQILRIGQIFFAYKDLSSKKTAIAATASGDEKGYRWNEDITQETQEKIGLAIDGALAKDGIYLLPIDVTQQLSAEKSYYKYGFWKRMAAGGLVMIPLAIVAVLALVLIIERFIFLQKQGTNTVKIAEDILAACHGGNFQKAEQIAIENPSVISRTLLACLSRRLEDTAVIEDAIAESILHELPKLERFLPSIGILAGVAPLLGLLGTVTGMITTFNTITIFGSGQPRLMAGGISEALLTTATGLTIAIPVLLIHSFLSSRSDKLIADTERFAATLLNLLKEQKDKVSEHTTKRQGKENETDN